MTRAIDTNVLFDLLLGPSTASRATRRALSSAAEEGPILIRPPVYAELAPHFTQHEELTRFLTDLGIELSDFSADALWYSGEAWRAYHRRRGPQVECPSCGYRATISCSSCQAPLAWRQHVIADFLIGGHALAQTDALLTRDPGYYRTYFPRLQLVVPGSGGGPSS